MNMTFSHVLRDTKTPKRGFIVPREGVEPSHLAIHDFESCAYTNSATEALRSVTVARAYQIY